MSRFARRVADESAFRCPECIRPTLVSTKTARLLLIGLIAVSAALLGGCGSDPGPEVWVIGLDGADWDQLDPMIARGELPHLAALRQGGAAGVLRSEKPLISPVLWTTIATGKSPDQHGVTWFMTDAADGTKTPVSSVQRQVRPLWTVASEAGLRSGVVGWWATWPADPLNGFLVSDYVGWHSFGVTGRRDSDLGLTWPADLVDTVRRLMPDPAAITADRLGQLVDLPAARLVPAAVADSDADPYANPLSHLRQAMATSRGYTDIVLDRLEHDRPAFLGVYYEGTDAVTHLFGDYQAPQLPWVSDEDYAAYHRVVDEYWKWQDELVGELLARRGPQTTIVVVSDHGFRVGAERRKEDEFSVETADADHMFDGVIIVNGPQVAAGARLQDADIYDVAPTVLYALGLPVAADMPGRVLTAALMPDVVAARPVRSVVTYETSPMVRADDAAREVASGAELEKMLRSLGYISGTAPAGSAATDAAAAATHTAPEEVVNLATVLMHQGRYDEAISKLRGTAAAYPELMEVRLNLAQALARTGETEQIHEGETIYRDLLAAWPDRLEIHEDLTTLLLNAGRNAEALAVFDQGLAQDPRWINGMAGKGLALFRLGRTAAAEQTLRAALGEDPRHGPANLALGQVLLKEGRVAASLPYLRESHLLDPADATAALRLADALQRLKQPAEALVVLQRCLDNAGPSAVVLAEKGAALMRQGQNAAAIAPLRESLALEPSNALALGNLGMALAMGGELPAAVSAFEKVVELAPQMADGHAQLGALYARTGKMSRAEMELQRAVDQDPDNPALRLNLGQVQVMNNQKTAARATYREALRLDPEFVPAMYRLGELEKELGNRAEADRLLRQAKRTEQESRSAP